LIRVVAARWGRGGGTILKELVEMTRDTPTPVAWESKRGTFRVLIFHSPLSRESDMRLQGINLQVVV